MFKDLFTVCTIDDGVVIREIEIYADSYEEAVLIATEGDADLSSIETVYEENDREICPDCCLPIEEDNQ